MIINDLIVVGADPEVVNAYVGSGSSDWFTDLERTEELLVGWKKPVIFREQLGEVEKARH